MSRFIKDESGATAIEYGLIVALIALAIFGSVSATGGGVGGAWNNMAIRIANIM